MAMTVVDVFVCPECQAEHADVSDAITCCYYSDGVEEVTQYACKDCEREFSSQEDAVMCCHAPEFGYKCGFCNVVYDKEQTAVECCAVDGTEEIQAYKCKKCEKTGTDRDEIDECCKPIKKQGGFKCSECGTLFDDPASASGCCD